MTQDHTILGATTTAAEVIAGVSLADKRAIVTGASAGPRCSWPHPQRGGGLSGKRMTVSLTRDNRKECAPLQQRIPPRGTMPAQKSR